MGLGSKWKDPINLPYEGVRYNLRVGVLNEIRGLNTGETGRTTSMDNAMGAGKQRIKG